MHLKSVEYIDNILSFYTKWSVGDEMKITLCTKSK